MVSMGGIVREALPALALTGLGALLAGMLLGHLAGSMEATPGIIVIIPALMGLRGNISGSLAARLGSATHLGLVSRKEPFNATSRNNLKAAMILSAATGLGAGAAGWALGHLLGFDTAPLWVFLIITGVTGLVSGVLLSFATLFIVLATFTRGLDPDNVAAPLLSTVGDLITLAILGGLLWGVAL